MLFIGQKSKRDDIKSSGENGESGNLGVNDEQ